MDPRPVHPRREGAPLQLPLGEVRVEGEAAAWRRFLAARSPAELFDLLEDDDPLGLVEQTASRLRQLAILHDVDQVHARVMARAAYEGACMDRPPGPQHVEARLNRWIDRSVEELAAEDRLELRGGHSAYQTWDPRYAFLTKVLGVPASETRRYCVAFNGLGREVRRSFFAITIEGLSVDVTAEREGFAPDVLRDRVIAGFEALVGHPVGKDSARTTRDVDAALEEGLVEDGRGETFLDPSLLGTLDDPGLQAGELLRTRDPRALTGVAGLVDAHGIHQPARPVLERHLARVALHEVAWLLRHAVLARLFDDPATARWLHRSIGTRRRHRPKAFDEIAARARGFRTRPGLFDSYEREIALIERGVDGSSPTVAELCQAAHGLFPGDQPLVCIAFDRIARGEFVGAESMLQRVLSGGPTDLHRSVVQENLGLLCARRGEMERALEHYRAAAATSELRPGPAISWLHTAALAGDRAELVRAASVLDELVRPEHSAVIERCQPTGAEEASTVCADARDAVESVRHEFGPTSLTVTDAYFGDGPGPLCVAATVSPVEAELLE